ncbi:hypothetical protein [Runella sp.]|uniref:hypothetical protein n=1 Tax=Runella sp. TaxID=1960881 RepID=UPI003D0D94E1
MIKVVFDTNFYREFVRNKNYNEVELAILKLKKLEFEHGFLPYLSVHVSCELLKHLKDEKGRDFYSCKKAIRAQYLHCSLKSQNHQFKVQIFTIPFKLDAIYQFWGQGYGIADTNFQKDIILLIKALHELKQKSILDSLSGCFDEIQELFESYRKIIISEMGVELLDNFNIESIPDLINSLRNDILLREKYFKLLNGVEFDDFITRAYFQALDEVIDKTSIDCQLPVNAFDIFKETIKPSIEFIRKFYLGIASGLTQDNQKILTNDKSKRWNSMIDNEIIFDTVLANAILVTNEIGIIGAYEKSNRRAQVYSSNEYFKAINYID